MNVTAQARPAAKQASAATRARSRRALSQMGESDLHGVVDLLRQVCEVEIAAVSVHDDDAFHYVVTSGIDPLVNPDPLTMCRHSMGTPDLFVIRDARADERTRHLPVVDGTAMSLRFYASAPLLAPDGGMVGRVCLFDTEARDLTPLQQQALLTMAESVSAILHLRLDRLDEADAVPRHRDLAMAARVSHDLRMPLTALGASLELLDDSTQESDDPTVALLIGSARRSVDRMSSLVDGLMRLHELTKEPRRSEVDLALVARRVSADLHPLVSEAGARVQLGDLPTVHADPDLMYSVLLNLLSNAVKFARPGVPPRIRVGARRVGDGWRVSVVDNGTGVPEQHREAVFGMFTRLTDAPGHGIGLTTVAQAVAAHGGRVGISDGADGVGAEISFDLPDDPSG